MKSLIGLLLLCSAKEVQGLNCSCGVKERFIRPEDTDFKFYSPGYPTDCQNVNCYWFLQSTTNAPVTISFVHFSLEYYYDFLYIYDGAGKSLGKCTGETCEDRVAKTGRLGLWLVSDRDDAGVFKGFLARVKTGGTPASTTTRAPATTRRATTKWPFLPTTPFFATSTTTQGWILPTTQPWAHPTTSKAWDPPTTTATPTLPPHTDTSPHPPPTTQADPIGCTCGPKYRVLAADAKSQAFHSPNFPGHYCDNMNCEWELSSVTGFQIAVSFSSFLTETFHDTLLLYDGPVGPDSLLETCTGSSCAKTHTANSGYLTARFTSDGSGTRAGWNASFGVVHSPQCGNGRQLCDLTLCCDTPRGETCCGRHCCSADQTCVNGACCGSGQTCRVGGSERCCAAGTSCRDAKGQASREGSCCSQSASSCRSAGGAFACCAASTPCCGGQCCPSSQCHDGHCCPGHTAWAGSSCCPLSRLCGSGRDECCGAGEACSADGLHCCPVNTVFCGGHCCATGQTCYFGTCY